MLNSFILSTGVGAILGFLTGLGTGGGSLLILWLTLVSGMEPSMARTINLMFFIPAALCASILRSCKGQIPWKKVLLPTLAGTAAAALISWCSQYIHTLQLQKVFGILLLFIGTKELFYRKRD